MPSRNSLKLVSVILLGGLVPSAYAAAPAWWAEQGVYTPGAQADDYAVANIGQLKHMASKAAALMESRLPGGAGAEITALTTGWSPMVSNPLRDDYAVLNQGQLKAVAQKFFFRLQELGYDASNLPAGQIYPWTTSDLTDDANYAAVNLGQLKHVFSFILINLRDPLLSAADTDGDGISNADEAALGLLANNPDKDGDGIPDGWEVAYGHNPQSAADAALDPDGDNLINRMEFVLKRRPNLDEQDMSVKLSASAGQFLFQSNSGILRAWGANPRGQLGLPATTVVTQATAVSFPGSVTVVETASGRVHGLAAAKSGFVYAWGDNEFGQLGDGSRTGRAQAAQLTDANLTRILQVAAGDSHSLALRGDGTVWAWGGNQRGQLGDGSTVLRLSPTQVPGLVNIAQIAAGARTSVALDSAGRIWVWGDNAFGQLADASLRQSTVPRMLSASVVFKRIGAGRHHVFALDTAGKPWLWGANSSGQLGINSRVGSVAPQAIASLSGLKGIVAGDRHTMAINSAGQVVGWGGADRGQLGLGTSIVSDQPVPSQISTGLSTPVLRLAAGQSQTVALETSGAVKAWGENTTASVTGLLGVASSAAMVSVPSTVVFAP